MELNVSPDFDAYLCYLVVVFGGTVAAVRQIDKRLGTYPGIWLIARTWILFFAYIAVPVALFWTLDRTGAISDTSLFAAIIVGVGYERILSGGEETLAAPQGLSRFWSPFLAYADEVVGHVRDRTYRNQLRFDEKLVAAVMESDQAYAALEQLALSHSADIVALQAALQAIDGKAGTLGAEAVREQKIRLLYAEASGLPDYRYLMREKKIIGGLFYYWYEPRWRGRLAAALMAVLMLGAVGIAAKTLQAPKVVTAYYVWRLAKPDVSKKDLFRA